MKIRLKNLKTILKDYDTDKVTIDEYLKEYLDFIPKELFGKTLDAKLFKDCGFGLKTYECCDGPHYHVSNYFIEEIIDD